MLWCFGLMHCYFILSHDTSDHFLNAKNSLRGDHPISHLTKLAVRLWKLEVGIISFCREKWFSEIFSNSSRRLREHSFLCMHVQTDSACIPVLDKQKWQRAGLTRFGVNMTVLEMTENNCQNKGEIVPAWDGQRGSGCDVAATGLTSVPVWCFCAGLFLWWDLITSPIRKARDMRRRHFSCMILKNDDSSSAPKLQQKKMCFFCFCWNFTA